MNEITLTWNNKNLRGLRPDYRTNANSGMLVECTNVKATPFGLAANGRITQAVSPDQLLRSQDSGGLPKPVWFNFPHPQYIRGSAVTLMPDHQYLFDDSNPPELITTYDCTDVLEGYTITAGGSWHFADMGDAWILCNGESVVFRTNYHNISGSTFPDKYWGSPMTAYSTCFHQGRAYLGGWDLNDETHPVFGASSLESNDIYFSSINEEDVWWNFFTSTQIDTYLGSGYYDDRFAEIRDMNQFGVLKAHYQGNVLCLKPLGEHVIAYGDGGVGVLTPVQGPISTVGYHRLSDVGICKRGAVGGDDQQHVFVAVDGNLWTIDRSLKLEKVGYKEYLWPMLGEDDDEITDNEVCVSFDPIDRDFYICNNNTGYVFNSYGLSRTNKIVTSLALVYSEQRNNLTTTGQLVGFYQEVE